MTVNIASYCSIVPTIDTFTLDQVITSEMLLELGDYDHDDGLAAMPRISEIIQQGPGSICGDEFVGQDTVWKVDYERLSLNTYSDKVRSDYEQMMNGVYTFNRWGRGDSWVAVFRALIDREMITVPQVFRIQVWW